MRISDWSSDVCSSDLTADRRRTSANDRLCVCADSGGRVRPSRLPARGGVDRRRRSSGSCLFPGLQCFRLYIGNPRAHHPKCTAKARLLGKKDDPACPSTPYRLQQNTKKEETN